MICLVTIYGGLFMDLFAKIAFSLHSGMSSRTDNQAHAPGMYIHSAQQAGWGGWGWDGRPIELSRWRQGQAHSHTRVKAKPTATYPPHMNATPKQSHADGAQVGGVTAHAYGQAHAHAQAHNHGHTPTAGSQHKPKTTPTATASTRPRSHPSQADAHVPPETSSPLKSHIPVLRPSLNTVVAAISRTMTPFDPLTG